MSSSSDAPLGPLASLPAEYEGLQKWRILLLVTSVNSFTQRVISYLQYLGIDQVSVQLAISDEEMYAAADSWDADLVLCPFLTKKLPEAIHNKWITLVVHPGPPGDAGPSSLDWVLLGDDGSVSDSAQALTHLLNTSTSDVEPTQRSHWGTICFQANEELDGGAVWAWEQYALPAIGTITKAQLYQGLHSAGAMSAVIHALCRVYERTAGAELEKQDWLKVTPKEEWSTQCVSLNQPFLGGKTHERPLLQSTKRRPDFEVHTAEDILRLLNASDSQPGAMLHPLTTDARASLFAYGAHVHKKLSTIPADLYTSLGYAHYDAVPHGKIIATRQGAIFVKTRQAGTSSAGIWITHGRIPRGKDKPIDPKIPMVEAIKAAGHQGALQGVKEWEQDTFAEKDGEWQEVFVRSVQEEHGVAQLVYWNFYNGAFTTQNCKTLLKALQWATSEDRGNVKLLALMGGNYFSNGIALNTIEHASSPGQETWENINAIDDLVSFLVGDTSPERPEFLRDTTSLAERGITTVACVRGNAAAGGVALAAGCDIVIAGRGVVLNPSYRAMGLHGSELHSYSYFKRCGPVHSATILREMKPLNTSLALEYGLIDIQLGSASQTVSETEPLFITSVRTILSTTTEAFFSPSSRLRCAPWCGPNHLNKATQPSEPVPLVDFLCSNKLSTYAKRDFPPLLHYRNEELSQMLLDSFHPIRSERYHSRRYKFIRKVKADSTPARYMLHTSKKDEEETREFDDAPGWIRGAEWAWAGLPTPESLQTSESTRIDIFYTGERSAKAAESESPAPLDVKVDRDANAKSVDGVMPVPMGERKHSEAPTMSTLPSLHASGLGTAMSPTSSSSGSELAGPTTPQLDLSPSKLEQAPIVMLPGGSADSRTPTSSQTHHVPTPKTQTIPTSSSAAKTAYAKSTTPGDRPQVGVTPSWEKEKDKEKASKFKSFRKKVKSALRNLSGDKDKDNEKVKDKDRSTKASVAHSTSSRSISSSASAASRPRPKSMIVPNPAQAKNVPPPPLTLQQHQGVDAIAASPVPSTTASAPPVAAAEATTTTTTTTQARKGECEWPCLVTGGEEASETNTTEVRDGVTQATISRPIVT
ncbi:methionyl-tRNA formyltransferase [Kwoniella heveanensis BCC8398]|uniref:Methionyl-tRNA formyltransferase n=1 Tax=Kwoniella heveanensis BCC8398 TaxID=1296120 RepID=A0A1B9GJG3_9TREE|nr:methionyl-tRNA formyltransferase [Kwoniella heveanensis BCC8398]